MLGIVQTFLLIYWKFLLCKYLYESNEKNFKLYESLQSINNYSKTKNNFSHETQNFVVSVVES